MVRIKVGLHGRLLWDKTNGIKRLYNSISAAAKVGISADRAANYHADGEGTRLNYEAVSQVVSEIRANRPIGDSWKAKIDADYERRGKNR